MEELYVRGVPVVSVISTELCAKAKSNSHNVTIDMLPTNVLLEIFGFCLCDPTMLPLERTKKWQRLVHVCRRWRQIIFSSPRHLDLCLSCSMGLPVKVRENLKFWPVTMPLTIDYPHYSLDPDLSAIDEANIVITLKHARRVHRVEVFASYRFLRTVASVMQKSFPALTHLGLGKDNNFFNDEAAPVLAKGFLNGSAPCLQYLCLKGFVFLEVPTLLLSSRNLVTLILEQLELDGFISPEAMVECLSGMIRLKTLSILFDYYDASDRERTQPDLPTRVILPSLIDFHYNGRSGYLENIVAQIDAPLLITLGTSFYSDQVLDQIQTSQLSRFIGHTENIKFDQFSHVQVYFWKPNDHSVVVELDSPQGKCPEASLSISLPRRADLHLQVAHTANLVGQLVTTFSNVNHLFIRGDRFYGDGNMDNAEWLPFLRLFPAVEELRLSGEVGADLVSALEGTTDETVTEVLPALHLIWIDNEEEDCEELKGVGSVLLRQFLSLRQRSGHPVTVVDLQEEFEEELASQRSGQENMVL